MFVDIFAKIGLINFLVAIFLGIQIILRKRDIANWAFSLLALSIAFWSFGYWEWLSATDATNAFLWVKIFTVGSILIPVFYLYWVVTLLGYGRKYLRTTIFLIFLSATLILNTFFTDYIVKGTQQKLIFPFWPIPGVLYVFYVLFIYIGLVSLALGILWNDYKKTPDPNRRSQVKYIFWGSLIGFSGGISNFFLWYNVQVPPYLNILVGIGLIIFYYAASKNNLFDVKVIATEFLTYLLGMAMVLRFVFDTSIRDRIIDGLVLILIIVVGYQLIKSVRREVEQRIRLEALTKELEAANEKLKELDKLKSQFLSFASHQVKSPMNVVKGFATLIYDGTYGPVSDKVRDTAIKIKESADRMIALVNNLLDLRKIEEGRMEFKLENADVGKLVGDMVEEYKTQTTGKGLILTYDKPADLFMANVDLQKFSQAIQNLIDNSIKYTENGWIKVSIALADDNQILIIVSDSGKGITKELLPKLFSQYQRESTTAGKIEGYGLGLFIAKQIIAGNNGEIWAESEGEGKGSKFCIKLPRG